MKTFCLSIAAALFAVGAVQVPAADLVVNGSFESPDVSVTPGRMDATLGSSLIVSPGTPIIPGWQPFNAPVALTRTPYRESWETLLAGEGAQALDLTGAPDNGQGGVEQSVATTANRDYVLTFQLGMYPGSPVYSGPIRVRVTVGAGSREFIHDAPTPLAGGVWQSFALPFRATATATLIRFQNVSASRWAALDRVAIADASVAAPSAGLWIPSWTVNGGGMTMSTSDDGRYALSATTGQPDAGLHSGGEKMLAGGFHYPGHSLRITRQDAYARVSWDFGLGTAAELQTTDALTSTPASTVWTPASLGGDARSVLFPLIGTARFFKVRED